MSSLIAPHGGELCKLLVNEQRAEELKQESAAFSSVTLTARQVCDLELLMNGALSPLQGFMTSAEYDAVLDSMHLPNGLLWALPITLDVSQAFAEALKPGDTVGLRDMEGFMLAVLHVEDIWQADKLREADVIYGSQDDSHPGVANLLHETGDFYIGGRVEGIQLPTHFDFETIRDTPEELRHLFSRHGWRKVVAFGSTKPMHRVHRDISLSAAKEVGAHVLIHPIVGLGRPGDLEYHARVQCYQAILKYYPKHIAMLSLLPMAMRMAGPREAIHNAIVRQNYGCSHIVIGPEHAAPPGVRQGGQRFYAQYSSQKLFEQYQAELGIQMVKVPEMQYVASQDKYRSLDDIQAEGLNGKVYKDKQLYHALESSEPVPEWFSFPDVIDALKIVCKPRYKKGMTLFFTGLSGSGKSTLANIVYAKFIEDGRRPVTLLDGDVVRQNLSAELGFSKEHRDINVKRIGYVASLINKNDGIAICAPIAPYASVRQYVRDCNEQYGAFIEIHVATPLEVCESRDRKGLYAKARKGEIKQFTGISDPYEEPQNPELKIDTSQYSPIEAAQEIMLYLLKEGYIES